MPPLLFVPDVARLLGISRQTAYSMIACGELAAVRVGKSGLRVFRDSLAEYLRGRVL
ncbi:helix-turn-helix domain-containing protein [Candidatus Poribacteria bacterium]|nr:helix-turn-helix domain-containing protein [Candidatus Poribacteria bacterium]